MKVSTKTVARKRRNTMERRCLSKSSKRMFEGMGRDVMRVVLAAERSARKKTSARGEQAQRGE